MVLRSCSCLPLSVSPRLIALTLGIFPYADPIVCGDLTGPCSLLGEEACVPRPVCFWQEEAFAALGNNSERIALQRSAVLWQGENGEFEANSHLAVPASVFLAGRATSAFDLAWYLAEHGFLSAWASVLCTAQKQGRGQLRRAWSSPQGNLFVCWQLPEHPALMSSAGAVVTGMLVVRALRHIGFDVQLKWPNDILSAEGKKVGGVLLEERGGILVAGLGINLAEAPGSEVLREDHAVSAAVLLPPCGGDTIQAPFFLWQALVRAIIVAYTETVEGDDLQSILRQAESFLAWKGRRVVIRDGGETVAEGVCLGFGPSGGVLITAPDGSPREYISGSVAAAGS